VISPQGLCYAIDTTACTQRLLVPKTRQKALISLTHRKSGHLGWRMNHQHLKTLYWWPTMSRDIREQVTSCTKCKLAKGTRRAAHTHWRASSCSKPRTSWGFDFKGMVKSSNGSKEIGGAIDMTTHKIILIALPDRTATTTAEALLQHLCHKEGTPLMFHTDAAAELMGRVMTELWRLQGTNATSTLAHHPTGNALCERMWRFEHRHAMPDRWPVQTLAQALVWHRSCMELHKHQHSGNVAVRSLDGTPNANANAGSRRNTPETQP
jgi:transposase-like protein